MDRIDRFYDKLIKGTSIIFIVSLLLYDDFSLLPSPFSLAFLGIFNASFSCFFYTKHKQKGPLKFGLLISTMFFALAVGLWI